MNTLGLQKIGDVLTKNSPTILTGVSVAGLITTTIMAVKATPKALKILAEDASLYDISDADPMPLLSKKDIVLLTWKCYIPAAVVGGVTIVCIIASNSINAKRYTALAGVYSLTEKAFKEYQSKVVEVVGAEKAKDIRDEVIKERMRNNPSRDTEIIHTGKGDVLCYENLSGRYFKSSREEIKKAVNEINKEMRSEMFVSLNELYYELGLAETKLGESLGWHIDRGYLDPSFDSDLDDDGTPCLVLDFNVEPKYNPYND